MVAADHPATVRACFCCFDSFRIPGFCTTQRRGIDACLNGFVSFSPEFLFDRLVDGFLRNTGDRGQVAERHHVGPPAIDLGGKFGHRQLTDLWAGSGDRFRDLGFLRIGHNDAVGIELDVAQ